MTIGDMSPQGLSELPEGQSDPDNIPVEIIGRYDSSKEAKANVEKEEKYFEEEHGKYSGSWIERIKVEDESCQFGSTLFSSWSLDEVEEVDLDKWGIDD